MVIIHSIVSMHTIADGAINTVRQIKINYTCAFYLQQSRSKKHITYMHLLLTKQLSVPSTRCTFNRTAIFSNALNVFRRMLALS